MLNDFVTGSLKTEEAIKTVAPARTALSTFREKGLPIFFANDSHYKTDFEVEIWGEHAIKGTEGSQVVQELRPLPGEFIIEKHAYSAFFGTPMDYLLKTQGVGIVVLAGLDADICVRHTAADAFFRGYRVAVIKDAVAARIDKNWEEYYKKVYGAQLINSSELKAFLNKNSD